MAKILRDVSGERVVKALQRIGYVHDHTAGSHAVLLLPGPPQKRVVVPLHRAVKVGTLGKIIKDVNLGVEEFLELL